MWWGYQVFGGQGLLGLHVCVIPVFLWGNGVRVQGLKW